MARFNPTTGEWSGFGNAADFTTGYVINAISELPGGDILATGLLGTGQTGVARFNAISRRWSSLDSNFAWVGDGLYYAQAHAVLPNGDIIVGGSFTAVGGVPANYIARHNAATGVWSALGAGTDGVVMTLKLLSSGNVLVGGTFSKAGNISTGGVALYNPTTQAWSALGASVAPSTNALALMASGDIVSGGPAKISRWNHTTQTWSTLTTVTGSTGAVYALAVLTNDDILAGGRFDKVGAISTAGIARYSASTSTWSGLGGGISGGVYSLLVLPDGDFLAGGTIALLGTGFSQNFVRCNPATGVWSQVGRKDVDNSISGFAVAPNGDVIAIGTFTKASSVSANQIARYKPQTGVWSALGSGILSGTFSCVGAAANGDVFVAGNFSLNSGAATRRVAGYSSSSGTWRTLGEFSSGTVFSLAVLPGGDLLAGGSFTDIGGVVANGITRYNQATGTWSAIANSPAKVYPIASLPNGDVVGNGSLNNAPRALYRYNPATGVWSELVSGFVGLVNQLALSTAGKLWVGGYFVTSPGGPSENVAGYDLHTGVWSHVSGGPDISTSPLYSLAAAGNDIVLSGSFTFNSSTGLARYSPDTHSWADLSGTKITDRSTLAGLPNGDFVLGGTSIIVNNKPSQYFAHSVGGAAKSMNQLSPQSSCRNGSASFTVDVLGAAGTLTYQWRKNGAPIDAALNPSAITPTLNLSNIQSSATYDCVVTGLCNRTVISNPATITMCVSDFNCDGFLTFEDFDDFVAAFEAGQASADFNNDGFLEFIDFDDFVVAFEAGC